MEFKTLFCCVIFYAMMTSCRGASVNALVMDKIHFSLSKCNIDIIL